MRKTWVVVADRSRARIFSVATPKGPLDRTRRPRAPRGARTRTRLDQRSTGTLDRSHTRSERRTAHAISRRTSSRARSRSTGDGRVEHGELERLIVVAAPDVLGMLRKTMNGNLAKLVVLEIDKNVTQRSRPTSASCCRSSSSMHAPVIIEAALNGGTPKRVNARVPITVDEIVADGIACLDAGASIIHHHNDEPVLGGDGRSCARSLCRDLATHTCATSATRSSIRRWPAVVTTFRSNGATHTSKRWPQPDLLDLGLVDPGTTNIGRFDADGAPRAESLVYQNTYADAVYMIETCRRLQLGHEHLDLRTGIRARDRRLSARRDVCRRARS